MTHAELTTSPKDEFILQTNASKLRLLETLDEQTATSLLEGELVDEINDASSFLQRPSVPTDIDQKPLQGYETTSETVRIARMCKLVSEGERVLDIGCGRGYVMSSLLLNSGPSHVSSLDITDRYFDDIRTFAEANNQSGASLGLEKADVVDLTRADIERHNPDLILMFEVLEHVRHPVDALRALGQAMRPQDLLMFSVPIQGRIEACWGHHHSFNLDAVAALLDASGLRLVWVEALHNLWGLFGAVPIGAEQVDTSRFFVSTTHDPQPIHLTLEPVLDARPLVGSLDGVDPAKALVASTGDIVLETPDLALLRLKLSIDDPSAVRGLQISGHHGDGTLACDWYTDEVGHVAGARSIALRPGWPTRQFRSRILDLSEPIQHVRIVADRNRETTVRVERAVYGSTDQMLTLPTIQHDLD